MSVIITGEDIVAAADQLVEEIAPVFEKVRLKVPAISVVLALTYLAKKIIEDHLSLFKPEEKKVLTDIICNFFDQTFLLLNPVSEKDKDVNEGG
jgi:hypothetical protein